MDEPTALRTELVATGGGTLAERWHEGVVARLLGETHYDVLVLQEQGGLLACEDSHEKGSLGRCAASFDAHRNLVRIAHDENTRVILFGTWSDRPSRQIALSKTIGKLARELNIDAVDVGAVFTKAGRAPSFKSLTIDDNLHPNIEGSMLAAIALNQKMLGKLPEQKDIEGSIRLYPPESYFTALEPQSNQFDPQPAQTLHISKETVGRLIHVLNRE